MRLLVGPGGALDLELVKEVGLLRLRLPLSRLEGLRLLRELSDQPVSLLGKLAALRLLAPQGGVGFAQLLLQGGVGLYKERRRNNDNTQQGRDVVAGEIRLTAQQLA